MPLKNRLPQFLVGIVKWCIQVLIPLAALIVTDVSLEAQPLMHDCLHWHGIDQVATWRSCQQHHIKWWMPLSWQALS